MNWKLSVTKTIISVILGILFFLWTGPTIGGMFSTLSIIGFLVGFCLVYIIWSLIQKEESVQSAKRTR